MSAKRRLTRRNVERLETAIRNITDRREVEITLDDRYLTIEAPRSRQRWQIPVREPLPRNPDQRPGLNLWSATMVRELVKAGALIAAEIDRLVGKPHDDGFTRAVAAGAMERAEKADKAIQAALSALSSGYPESAKKYLSDYWKETE